jgi:hypothetical protein
MKPLAEAHALALLQRGKARYQSEIKLGYEHRAQSCRTCPTPGVCCTDAHFVNIHITRLEAAHIRETLARTPRLDDKARREVYERARAAVARYGLTTSGDTFRQTYSCPLFAPGTGCLIHARAKPAPCIQHACYDNWEDVPPAALQWQAETRVENLNTRVYGAAWAWLPTPVWLTLVDPDADGRELERLACVWSARRETTTSDDGNYRSTRSTNRSARRSLPVLR